MIKVLIVISGLVMFVPAPGEDPQWMTALLLETKFSHGMTALHVPALRQQIDDFSVRNWYINSGDFKAVLRPNLGGAATIDLGARKYFPQLSQLTPKAADGEIHSDCLAGKCVDASKKKRVAATIKFEGRWRTRPLLRCAREWIRPVDFQDESKSDFRLYQEPKVPKADQPERPLATALALEAEIEKLEDLYFTINGIDQKLYQLTEKSLCQAWLGASVSSCVVLELENWPESDGDPDCNKDDPPAKCRFDLHFSMFYDLILNPPNEDQRWLPYVAAGKVKCPNAPGPGNPPGIRCPPTFLN